MKKYLFFFALMFCSFAANFAKSHNFSKRQVENLESTNGVNINSVQKLKFNNSSLLNSNIVVEDCLSQSITWVTEDAQVAELQVFVECGSRPPKITKITYNEY